MPNKKNLTEKEIAEKIRKVDGAMAQEGMPLTDELKSMLHDCYTGKSTLEQELKKAKERYRKIYG